MQKHSPQRVRSAIYEGTIRHRRLAPRRHDFQYRMFMLWIDLEELPSLFDRVWFWSSRRPAVAWFRRGDYLGNPAVPLDQSVRDLVEERTGRRPQGAIRMLSHLRYFGHCFNPVTFYYCYEGERLETIVSEIENTPWKERHAYVLRRDEAEGSAHNLRFALAKCFHVSPFQEMNLQYDWWFREPGRVLTVHMGSDDQRGRMFDATLILRRRAWSAVALQKCLWSYPLLTVRVLAGIYWHALRLRLKGFRFHPHPEKRPRDGEVTTP